MGPFWEDVPAGRYFDIGYVFGKGEWEVEMGGMYVPRVEWICNSSGG